ncbi:MAG: Rpn family recombination-promoting nuclease/putative transposase [Acetatifactor sp.]|nr:Rpn family recombination-promoting nuclease/putative transposase [Acetatifactor sp.]
MEYGEQIDEIQRRRRAERKANGLPPSHWAEQPGRGDRLNPVYTICFYHGTEKWDGPRSLKDMMDFGGRKDIWQKYFHDYEMTLFCANTPGDLTRFHTDLRQLLEVLPLRKDKKALSKLWSGNEFSHLSRDTMETMAIMTDSTEILENIEKYMTEGGYSMCLAVEEMRRDWKEEGRTEGEALQIISIIDNMMENLQCSLERACEIAGRPPGE